MCGPFPCPPQLSVGVPIPNAYIVTVFGDRVLQKVIKLKWGQYAGEGSCQLNMTGVLIRRGDQDTGGHRGKSREFVGRR